MYMWSTVRKPCRKPAYSGSWKLSNQRMGRFVIQFGKFQKFKITLKYLFRTSIHNLCLGFIYLEDDHGFPLHQVKIFIMYNRKQTTRQGTWWEVIIFPRGHLQYQKSCLRVPSLWSRKLAEHLGRHGLDRDPFRCGQIRTKMVFFVYCRFIAWSRPLYICTYVSFSLGHVFGG